MLCIDGTNTINSDKLTKLVNSSHILISSIPVSSYPLNTGINSLQIKAADWLNLKQIIRFTTFEHTSTQGSTHLRET